MSRTLVTALSEPLARAIAPCVVAGAVGMGSFGVASAEAQANVEIALSVSAGPNGSLRCFEVEALRQRIAHYSATGLAGARELRLELEVETTDSAELQVYRGSELVARRHFDHLPIACADRRDAVALSIALALDGVIHELAPAPAPDASASAPAAAGASDGAETDQSRQADSAPAPEPVAHASNRIKQADRRSQSEPTQTQRASAATPQRERSGKAGPPEESGQDAAPARRARGIAPVWHLHAGGRLLAQALPSPVWTGALGAELSLNRRFAIDAAAFTSTTADTGLAGARAQTSMTGGELLGCSMRILGNFAAEGCLGAIAAACAASGRNYPVPFPAKSVLWAASTARIALRWPDQRRVAVRLVVQGHVNMVRPELRVDGSTERLAPSWLGGSAGLDLLVSLE